MFDGAMAEAAGAGEDAGNSRDGEVDPNAEPTVVYGKEEADDDAGQVGTDDDRDDSEENEPLSLDDEFESLIKGKYKDQFGSRVQGIIQNRFKNAQNYQEQVGKWQDATSLLIAKYGLDVDDVDGLKNAIENDDGFFAGAAEEDGITADRYKENLRLKIDAQRGRNMQQELQKERQKQETFRRWDAEAERVKEAFPNFDLEAELENEIFSESLNRGNNVWQSFLIAHMDEILSGSSKAASQRAQEEVVKNIKSRAARPQENGVNSQAAVIRKDDPSKMSDDDLFEVARRARTGEHIKF